MAKAVKIAALVVGVAALTIATAGAGLAVAGGLSLTAGIGAAGAIAGVSLSTLALVGAGLSVAGTLLQKSPKVTASQTERLNASVDPRAFRKTWLGQTAGPVDVRYEEWSGTNQEICDWIIALASHAIDGVDEIWFDTQMAWSATTGVVGKYVGYFSIPNLILEGSPQNAFTFASGKWNAGTAHMTGCAYARFRFKVTGNSKKTESPFSSGIPSRITIIGRGAKLYDPRRDSTVPGGSGPMRWDDQSTWRYTADDGAVIGENLPLQILRVVLGWRIRNPVTGVMKLATGSGVPGRRISFPSFQIAANLADELVNRAAGGNEPRYHGAGVISEGDDQKTVLDMLCSACCSRFRDTGGKLALVVSHNDLAAAATDDGLNDDDVVGAFTWDPDPSLEATPNIVRGKYVDPTTASLYQLIDYPEVSLPSPDGQDRYMSLDLGVVESPSHAQRVAKQVLQRRQYARQFTAPFDIRAWKYGVGDVLPFTFAPLGFTRGLFRVKEQELGQGGTCNMVLTFETPDFYLWDASDALPVQAADPIVYDSRNNPLILAIDEAATTSYWSGVTGVGKPADNADVTGDNKSRDTDAVGGRSSAEIKNDLDLNGRNWFDMAQLEAGRDALMLARTTLNAKPIGTVVTQYYGEFQDSTTAIAETFSLIGAKSGDGQSWILDQSSVKVGPADGGTGPVQSLAQRFQSISASLGANSGSISNLQTVLISPSGGVTAKAVFALNVNGQVSGIVQTSTGAVSTIDLLFSAYNFRTPSGSSIFSYSDPANGGDGKVYLPDVVVRSIAISAVGTAQIGTTAIRQGYAVEMSGNVDLPGATGQRTRFLSLTVSKQLDASSLRVSYNMRPRPGRDYASTFVLGRNSGNGDVDMDAQQFWLPSVVINNLRSLRIPINLGRTFEGLPAGQHTIYVDVVAVGGGNDQGFMEAGSNLYVEEVKR